jgi:FlaA1/EpsC-like NDP-sugar epimerase
MRPHVSFGTQTHGSGYEPQRGDPQRSSWVVRRFGSRLTVVRTPVQAGIDALAWFIGIAVFQFVRFDFSFTSAGDSPFTFGDMVGTAVLAALLQMIAGLWVGLYRNHWRYGSIDEMGHLVASVAAVAVVLTTVELTTGIRPVPVSVPIGGAIAALVIMAGVRYSWRMVTDLAMRPDQQSAEPVLVIGAGEGGEQLLTSMLRNPTSRYVPVGLLDDDPTKARLSIRGIQVVGTTADLETWASELEVTTVIVAIPSAPPAVLRRMADAGLHAGLTVCTLPPVDQLFDGNVDTDLVRPVAETDLLGRSQIDTNVESIAGYLQGRRVLVTGAGGSIGSELCRQISTFGPAHLVMLDRDESALHAVQLSITGRAMLDDDSLVVADIRDRDRIAELFVAYRPQVVFHAAALKHLTLVERFPSEALKTNVVGTQNVIDAAIASGVERFVNVSTDKAADPTSVLGFTKRIAERLTAAAAHADANTYLSVRFGNVLGSRGSVLTAFRAQIDEGGPVTVTDPEVTRFFMTVEEAVQLLIQAGAVGADGDALVLDMGDPVRIDDVARRLIAEAAASGRAPKPVTIEYTGLRPGEKLHESLFGADEVARPSGHPSISRVDVPPVEFAEVAEATIGVGDSSLTSVLQQICTGSTVRADD